MRSRRSLIALILLSPAAFAQAPPMGGPPPEAFSACSGQAEGGACRFSAPHGQVTGTCRRMREPNLVCVPAGGPPGGGAPAMGGARGAMNAAPDMGPGGGMPGPGPASGADIAGSYPGAKRVRSRAPDTGQGSCFDNGGVIDCPREGQPFYGQDAHYLGAPPAYRNNGDGTVTDMINGLMWQQGHNTQRLGWYEARQACAGLRLGGRGDWRLPNIKELFSIADFSGATGRRPFLAGAFEIRAPGAEVLAGDRFAASHRPDMMGQTWSATLYAGQHWDRPGVEAAFFFNFLDGRIKQAPTRGPQGMFYRCVRGAPWGANALTGNGDGTVTDRATGLMWQQADDGRPREWQAALAYCESLTLASHADWRLPNVKELQGIVDYGRPAPALDTRVFRQQDPRGWFWSSTTHGENPGNANYVCFGKCTAVDGVDVHGAGAQRSDPKTGDPARYGAGAGGQRDEVRIRNYARCVRSVD